MGYSSWGCKESDTTKAQTHAYCVSSLLCAGFCEQRLLFLVVCRLLPASLVIEHGL